MRTGLLTFHASHNYGSVLQAYALSRTLANHGHDAEIINLRTDAQIKAYPVIEKKGIHRFYQLLHYPLLRRRYNEYEQFINNILPTGKEKFASTQELSKNTFDYEAYICGSDQIWNPACPDFEDAYFLSFLRDDDSALRIAYAPSLGKSSFSENELSIIRKGIKRFDRISVREETGASLLRTMTDKSIDVVCDPVLLLGRSQWEEFAVKPKNKKPYILVYFLDNNHGSRDQLEFLRKNTGYHVITINEYTRDFFKPYHKAYGTSPKEFVGLLANAGMIYTNSFHGTVFATIFEKPFITAIAKDKNTRNNSDSRKTDYLKRCGLMQCVYQDTLPNSEELMHIDFTETRRIINDFRKSSTDYLLQALKRPEERES